MEIKLLSNYWITQQLGGAAKKWKYLEHHGVLFPPEYIPHFVPVIYQGREIVLDKDAEEAATLYAKYYQSEYLKNKTFTKNFWKDWKKILGKDHQIQNIQDCDFRLIYDHLLRLKEEKKLKPTIKDPQEDKYKFAMVDGKIQPVGNFRIEPPGLFIGRGCNPKIGMIKRRLYPEDIIINIGKNAPIPSPIPGHQWKNVIHDNTVEWLASWKDDITGKVKYVWLGAESDFKAKSDLSKFDLARKLKKKIKEIRRTNIQLMENGTDKEKQVSTALFFIDNFALRVGNEKGEDEADTVGVTSLRVEHVKLLENGDIRLDFLGKDSVRYNRVLPVPPIVYQNIRDFTTDKKPSDQLFDLINSSDVNKYLQSFMKKLTAKVFRTFNASYTFQKELQKISSKFDKYQEADKINLLLDEFNKANAKVAILCNHQKNVNQSSNKQIEKIDEMIKKAKSKLKDARKNKTKNAKKIEKLKDTIKKLQAKKIVKIELKNVSLGTSKINYIDPRITIAFVKKHQIPINKVFTKTLQEKFKWAMEADENYKF